MRLRNWILFGLCAVLLAAALAAAYGLVRDTQTQTRGVTFRAPGDGASAVSGPIGINAALEQYGSQDLNRALALLQSSQFTLVRQHFYWKDIEPRRGEFDWTAPDRIVSRASQYKVELVAVLDTTPVWARDPGEADLDTAPPAHVEDYARFVAAFTQRYSYSIHYVQLWDNPNVHPYWGRRIVDPIEYTALLHAGAVAAHAAHVKVISAGLSPNAELIRGHADYSDVLFLRGMYDAGAHADFDILGVKAYGMWTGPEDRRVAMDVFNFSRVILLRDEMVSHGDAAKPVWAVEMGWNALPQDWGGKSSPWGTDTEPVQSDRTVRAIQRAWSEWPWMTTLLVQTFQPNAAADDPVWGFALFDKNFNPRPQLALTHSAPAPVAAATFDFPRVYGTLAALALMALVALAGGAVAGARLPWQTAWLALAARFAGLPEIAQVGMLGATVAVFYWMPNTVLSLALLVVIVFLFALRLDLGLAITVVTIPFYLLPKNLVGSMQFSLVEILTLASVAAWGVGQVKRKKVHLPWRAVLGKGKSENRLLSLARSLTSFDYGILFFVFAGLVSVKVASNFGVANREFRVVVLEPALLYALIRLAGLTRRDLWRLVHAFLLSALAIALVGLYQYFFTNYVIIGEGVRRILAVYGSPNNLALYLDRALPLLAALVLLIEDRRRRIAYAVAALVIAACWYLTYSRAAWLGIAASLVLIGWFGGRRARLVLAATALVGVILLIPLLSTDRFQSLFQNGTGTGFFRVSVWKSGALMIRDHPLLGVGLDNFLYEYPKYMQPDAWREPNLSHPHNIILDFWVRMGVLGLVALGWMLFEFFRRALRQIDRERALMIGLMAGMTAALAHGMMDAAYFYVDLAFVFMLMFGVVADLSA